MAELSGFEVLALVREISSALRGTYVNNIYSVGGSQLIRFRKPESDDVWLVVSPKKGVWVSQQVEERAETTEFTSKLRGELERAKFSGASQADLDRVFELEFEAKERRRLIVELMPPGNVIVTDGEGRVLLAQDEVRSQSRRMVRGSMYNAPTQSRQSPGEVGSADVLKMLQEEKTVGTAIGRHVALPRKYVAECLNRLGVTDDTQSSNLAGREEEVVRVLSEMVAEARDSPKPCLCETPKGEDVFVVPPHGFKLIQYAKSTSELCDRLFLQEALEGAPIQSPEGGKRKELEATIAKLRSESESLLAEASKVRSAAGAARAAPLQEGLSLLRTFGVRLNKEPTTSASVASALFDQAKRLELKSDAALGSARRLEKRLSKVAVKSVTRTKTLSRRKQEWYEKFRWFYTSGGKLAVGGRDAQTNSALIARRMDANDTVYHADLFGSPFFILKGGKEQSEEEIRQLAQGTVAFSSAWKTGLGSADAYWVSPDQISKAAPSGEYLARGSFAIRGKKNFVTKNIVEVAVGLNTDGRVLVGPESAIAIQSARYLVLRPQREKGSDTAKRVLKDLVSSPEGSLKPPALDEVLRMLPTGGGKVVRRGGSVSRAPRPA